MDAAITGIGWVTAAGPGRGGENRTFAVGDAPLPSITRKMVFAEPNQRFGRQSEYSRIGLAAIAFALRDAGLEIWTGKRPIGIVATTMLGCLTTDVDYFATVLPQGGGLPSPNLFAYTLPSCFLGEAAIQFGLTGTTLVFNEEVPTGLASVRTALECLAWGECPAMLAGVCDLPAPPGFSGVKKPLPGAVFMVIESTRCRTDTEYGTLQLNDDDTITHNGAPVATFIEAVHRSLATEGT